MISLVPSWARHYNAFWEAIRRRNLWLIKLRYGAVVVLTVFFYSSEFILKLKFSAVQNTAVILITISILFYNLILHRTRKYLKCESNKFNPLHFSLLQMLLDLLALFFLIYYTGSIESPLFWLFNLHMVIGSLILPGMVIYSVAAGVAILFNALVFGEYFGMITHHTVYGFLEHTVYTNINYITSHLTIFVFLIITSVLLVNMIANQLYKIEQELVESIEKINAAEVEKQKYIISIVHEIKSPISAVHSFLDIILKKYLGPLEPKLEEKLNRARIRSAEAINLINNILKVSRLRLLDEVVKEQTDINEIILGILGKQKVNTDVKNIKISYSDVRKEKYLLIADPFLIEIALSNLIVNALKYAGANGLIEICLNGDSSKQSVSVSDNGVGIPQNDFKKIFKDFYRASNIKQESYEGAGLGLSIVKQIAEKHGGYVTVESPSSLASESRPGACFNFVIPVK